MGFVNGSTPEKSGFTAIAGSERMLLNALPRQHYLTKERQHEIQRPSHPHSPGDHQRPSRTGDLSFACHLHGGFSFLGGMMTVDQEEIERMNQAYEQMFDVFELNKLTPEMTFGLLVRLVVQISGDIPKPELLEIISAAHDLDRFMRIRSEEVH
jgi:hypothetical protein